MATSEPRVVFLDANVLAKPLTRTLILVGSGLESLAVTWSASVEVEADRHRRAGAIPVSELRTRILGGRDLSATGPDPARFAATASSDRQVLADVEAAGAGFLITENVEDFGEQDLIPLGASAVNPDLFMANRYSRETYQATLRQIAERRKREPRSVEELHRRLARRHPRPTARHADAFEIKPTRSAHPEPSVLFRGARCIRCGRSLSDTSSLKLGLGPECRRALD